jgi:hypothetical protein
VAPVTSPLETTPVIEIVEAGGLVVTPGPDPPPPPPPPPHADRHKDAINAASFRFCMMLPNYLLVQIQLQRPRPTHKVTMLMLRRPLMTPDVSAAYPLNHKRPFGVALGGCILLTD